MGDRTVQLDRAAVRATALAVYHAAGLDASHAASSIAPLQKLLAAFPITWIEVPGLTRAVAATVLREKIYRSIDLPPGQDEPLAGRLYADETGGIILVRLEDPLGRRRFTVAHEMGHYILHHLPRLAGGPARFDEELPLPPGTEPDDTLAVGQTRVVSPAGQEVATDPVRLEAEADLFAAELLLPEPLCRALVEVHRKWHGDKQQVLSRRLASECLVSQTAMLRRLRELQLPEGMA